MIDEQVELTRIGDFSMNGLCSAILEQHQSTIRTRKPHVAVAKLAKIVDTILKLSNKQGFHATSLREISIVSGVSMGGLYSYFDSKDTLLMMILGQVSTSVTAVLESAPASVAGDPAAHLRWLIKAHVTLTETMLPWFVFSFMEAKSFPPVGRKMAVKSEEWTERVFSDVLSRGVDAGVFAIDRPEFTASLIKPMLQDWYVKRSKWRRRSISAPEYSEMVCAFIEAAIGVKPGSRAEETPRPQA
ncbi:TetR/AcrR family transcriptional regulator [Chelatococcus asaccharovorans]|uniref:TetR/AcrR family transcriptional regulator n=1 Tax=Chelatococcus asaccharovorans TaxID=28210 RepID=UPI00224C6F15|nr:TetR/AcrR family transcriptional regulator [Chelatococcus asaccharovorans]CAH1650229.1 TetR family transcriptional regulator [Chelatococcus asaccharovorans]CAH1692131.1 TetR family transcriptional regulator [Chelatococcus asaccharovorans]